MGFPRRTFLAAAFGLTAGAVFPGGRALAVPQRRALSFDNLHTGEKLSATYWTDGTLVPEACRKIDWVLRDHRSGEAAAMAPRLLDLLYVLRASIGTDAPFEVISGYRSPATNDALARASAGVAHNSLHMQGMAIDIRLPDCKLPRLREQAAALKLGGVGYYPKSDFVHVDVGRVRYW